MNNFEEKSKLYQELDENYLKFHSCPVAATLGVVGGKWKPIILYLIYHDVQRFGALHRRIENISKKVLTEQLRELEEDGIIHRKVFPQVPPKVEYSMTEKGISLRPMLLAMRDWGLKNVLSQ